MGNYLSYLRIIALIIVCPFFGEHLREFTAGLHYSREISDIANGVGLEQTTLTQRLRLNRERNENRSRNKSQGT
jgi:hypothetical protein